jgi:hypothetical protein
VRVIIYDKKPGVGFGQWLLMASWAVGAWLHKLLGYADDVLGAESWDEALSWLQSHPGPLSSIQYWGHGSPGVPWLAQKALPVAALLPLKPKLSGDCVIWWRCCSVFQGHRGHSFASALVEGLGCTVAAHTRVIGPWQPGLHVHRPGQQISWTLTDGTEPLKMSWWPEYLRPWLPRTVFCLRAKLPKYL